MIRFNIPTYMDRSMDYIREAAQQNEKICGDGPYTKKASEWLEQQTGTQKILMTTSCSHALDMMCMLIDLQEGDEVIIPSYNFVSGANSIAMRGGVPVFVDIRPDTMNLDETLIEAAITPRTKAIFAMHYAGVSCEMDAILGIARKHRLHVLEDAAQGMMASYRGRALGSMGTFGSFSFHETKNYVMGEGGCLMINDSQFIETAEILREKGTDRSKFWRGQVDKYTWQSIGSSYLPSEMNVAYLWAQMERAQEINQNRLDTWEMYHRALQPLEEQGKLTRPIVPEGCIHNGHMYYIKCENLAQRTKFIEHMKENGVMCVFHYIPLHSAPAGERYGRFAGEDVHTTKESERLVRLPLYYGISDEDRQAVVRAVKAFF